MSLPESNSEIPPINRRTFLKFAFGLPIAAGTGALLQGCVPSEPQPPSRAPDPNTIVMVVRPNRVPRQVEGEEWSHERIEEFATSMQSDPEFRLISHAGEILQRNQRGEASVSEESDIFSDNKIRIFTVENIEHPSVPAVPMDAQIEQNYPALSLSLRSKTGRPNWEVYAGTSLYLDTVRVNQAHMEGKSEFLWKLFMAKEVFNISAFDMAIKGVFSSAYRDYELPTDDTVTKVLRVNLLSWKIPPDMMPLDVLADIWAHHLILPEYELAKDLGLLSEEERQSLIALEYPSDYFKSTGLLYLDERGQYRWRSDNTAFLYDQWYKAAFATWKTIF